jgi:hypothetical protein
MWNYRCYDEKNENAREIHEKVRTRNYSQRWKITYGNGAIKRVNELNQVRNKPIQTRNNKQRRKNKLTNDWERQ